MMGEIGRVILSMVRYEDVTRDSGCGPVERAELLTNRETEVRHTIVDHLDVERGQAVRILGSGDDAGSFLLELVDGLAASPHHITATAKRCVNERAGGRVGVG